VLTSPSLQVNNIFDNINQEISREVENTKAFLYPISESVVSNLQIIQSQNFLNRDFYFKDIKIKNHYVDNGKFEKKYKILLELLNDSLKDKSYQTIICSNETNLSLLNSQFFSRKIDFAIIDDCTIYLI
jgi:hypothetical protein